MSHRGYLLSRIHTRPFLALPEVTTEYNNPDPTFRQCDLHLDNPYIYPRLRFTPCNLLFLPLSGIVTKRCVTFRLVSSSSILLTEKIEFPLKRTNHFSPFPPPPKFSILTILILRDKFRFPTIQDNTQQSLHRTLREEGGFEKCKGLRRCDRDKFFSNR